MCRHGARLSHPDFQAFTLDTPGDTYIALFTYGGGMRGLIPAYIMSYIEKQTGLYMSDMVDIFTGPSTGAILNAALNRPHPTYPHRPMYRARHLVKFYQNEGINIFPPDTFRAFRGILHDFNNRTLKLGQLEAIFRHGHYDPAPLGHALKALYGDTKLSESLSSLIIPTYNIDGGQLHVVEEPGETDEDPVRTKNNFMDQGGHAVWLKNIVRGKNNGPMSGTPDVGLYDAVMASCAAPSYFPCHHFTATYPDARGKVSYTGIDGNLFDNPCISYLGAIRNHLPKNSKIVMIVLGTGYTNRSIKRDEWNKYGALGIVDPVNDLPLINVFFHASESALLETFENDMGDNLFIFNKSMIDSETGRRGPSTQIDDATPENMASLKIFAEELIEEHKTSLDAVCQILATRRDVRVNTIREEPSTAKSFYYKFFGKREADRA